ncbi:hypothetical protein Tco_0910352 [Tanacetum coccineum]|uniref:Uncharacterized protein n=1 Tax=Tanacetum coccineum TaxID=301880 RepID=A0ABQ5CVD4_9ASTR
MPLPHATIAERTTDEEMDEAKDLLQQHVKHAKKVRARNATRVLCNPTSAFRSVDASSDQARHKKLMWDELLPRSEADKIRMMRKQLKGKGIELLILKQLVEKPNFLELAIDDPAAVVTVKPATKQTVKNIANERQETITLLQPKGRERTLLLSFFRLGAAALLSSSNKIHPLVLHSAFYEGGDVMEAEQRNSGYKVFSRRLLAMVRKPSIGCSSLMCQTYEPYDKLSGIEGFECMALPKAMSSLLLLLNLKGSFCQVVEVADGLMEWTEGMRPMNTLYIMSR